MPTARFALASLVVLLTCLPSCAPAAKADCFTRIGESFCIAQYAPFDARSIAEDQTHAIDIDLRWSGERITFIEGRKQDASCQTKDGVITVAVRDGLVMTTPESMDAEHLRYAYGGITRPDGRWLFDACSIE